MARQGLDRRCSRRTLLGASALAAAALTMKPPVGLAGEPPKRDAPRSTVRDRLWIFTVFAGGDNASLESGGVRGGSRIDRKSVV